MASVETSDRSISALAIARRAHELQVLFLGSATSLVALLHPQLPILQWNLAVIGARPDGDAPIVFTGSSERSEDTEIAYSMRFVLTKLSQLSGDVVRDEMMSGTMLLGAIRLGDMIARGGFNTADTPLLEFSRHFRNACAHGDRWHFRGHEPRHRAELRDLVLTQELDGKRATWETVTAHHYIYYLDDIADHFMKVAKEGLDTDC